MIHLSIDKSVSTYSYLLTNLTLVNQEPQDELHSLGHFVARWHHRCQWSTKGLGSERTLIIIHYSGCQSLPLTVDAFFCFKHTGKELSLFALLLCDLSVVKRVCGFVLLSSGEEHITDDGC